jgi:hypothetical protein
MKKQIPLWAFCLTALFLFSFNLMAQEQTEVSVRIKKDGRVIRDTAYQFKDMEHAEHALMLMEILIGDIEHPDSGDSEATVLISEDGKKTTIEVQGDSLLWITEEQHDGDHVKVIKKKIRTGDEDVDVELEKILEEQGEGENVKVIKKKVKAGGNEEFEKDENVKVIIVKTKEEKQ